MLHSHNINLVSIREEVLKFKTQSNSHFYAESIESTGDKYSIEEVQGLIIKCKLVALLVSLIGMQPFMAHYYYLINIKL